MPAGTSHYYHFVRGIIVRRSSFLFRAGSRELIYPSRGALWEPSKSDEAMCDAFIFFTVSELETYFEGILNDSLKIYEDLISHSVIKECGPSSDFIEKLVRKRGELSKNNNANWSRISHFFKFVGLSKDVHFPEDFWDDVDTVVKHRGDLAHNGLSLKIVEDRRNVIHKIEEVTRKVRIFDEQYHSWLVAMRAEVLRLSSVSLKFDPTF